MADLRQQYSPGKAPRNGIASQKPATLPLAEKGGEEAFDLAEEAVVFSRPGSGSGGQRRGGGRRRNGSLRRLRTASLRDLLQLLQVRRRIGRPRSQLLRGAKYQRR